MKLKCRACKAEKAQEAFTVLRRSKTGRNSRCLECDAAHRSANRVHIRALKRAHYAANRESLQKAQRASYLKHKETRNKKSLEWQRTEEGKARRRASYKRNADKIKARASQYTQANRELVREQARQYYAKNAEKWIAANHKRRARLVGATIQAFTSEMLDARAAVFGFACAYCGGLHEHWDHVIPIARGGYHCLANLRPACSICNKSKGAKRLAEWLESKKAA